MNTSEFHYSTGENYQPSPLIVTSAAGVPNPMAAAAAAAAAADAPETSKRTALAGQWRTPPTPFFPSGGTMEELAAFEQQIKLEEGAPSSNSIVQVVGTSLAANIHSEVPLEVPHSTEDYAKALQEAYRRGAEAAARAAAQQMASATSCPDLPTEVLKLPQSMILPVASSPTPLNAIASTPAVEGHHQQQQQPMQVQVQLVHHHHMAASAPTAAVPVTLAPSSSSQHSTATTAAPLSVAALPVKLQQQQQQQQRSLSLPDMSSYAAQQEEEKRQKRLARNRASARLRRLRKKNLVDAYETEVGSLEKTTLQLQQHEWGASNSALALAEALSMDRGQQKLTAAERCEAATDILSQQLQFLQQLEDLMQEQYVLQQMATCTLNGKGENSEWKDLQETLQLSPEQCHQLIQQSAGWEDEWNALQTVKASLQAMKDNNWLWNEGCSSIADQFLSILHNNQISKFLLWADHNAETIEELDAVHAVNAVADAPIFQFGVDSNPNEMLEDEKMPS